MTKYTYISPPKETISLSELEVGDIICTHGERWLSEKIQHFMQVQGHWWYKVEMWSWYNHMLTWIDSEKHTIGEAIASGYNLHPIEKYYSHEEMNRMIVIRPEIPFTETENEIIIAGAEYFDIQNIKYEFTNFLWWMPYIYSKGKIDFSPKGPKADDRLFCFEAAMMLWDKVRDFTGDASKITTVSLLLGKAMPVKTYRLQYT